MTYHQSEFSALLLLMYAILATATGYQNTIKNRNPYGHAFWFLPLGVFVWGDALVLGIFWAIVAGGLWFWGTWQVLAAIFLLFWLIRSLGEVQYWMLVQFSTLKREPPENHFLFPFIKSDAVWFINQVIWQCVAVLAGVGLWVSLGLG
ncbi:MAG: hypothetical protein WAU07_05495 [Microgenomates group bacterium]